MKKLITFSAFLCLFANINAQIHKGSWLISGSAEANRDKYDYFYNNKNNYRATIISSIRAEPKIGYFVNNNLCVGARLGTSFSLYNGLQKDTQTTDISIFRVRGLTIAPFARYYTKAYHKIRAYAELSPSLGVNYVKEHDYTLDKSYDRKVTYTRKDAILVFDAGLNYFITPNIALEGNLRYFTNVWNNGEWVDELNDFELNPTLAIQLYLVVI